MKSNATPGSPAGVPSVSSVPESSAVASVESCPECEAAAKAKAETGQPLQDQTTQVCFTCATEADAEKLMKGEPSECYPD
jgi:hypothetical protein